MIFFGTNSFTLKSEKIAAICPTCNNANSTFAHVFLKYFHLFWIPTFPFSKYAATTCDHCELVTRPKEFSEQTKRKVDDLKSESGIPIKSFAGLILIGLLIAGVAVMASFDDKNTQEYVKDPQKNDRYFYKMEDGNFTSMKVASVTSDSVFFNYNKNYVTKKSQLSKIDKPDEYFTTDIDGYSKKELNLLMAEKVITKIKRD